MAVKKTKKLSAQTTTTTVATGEKFAKVDANGKVTLIDLANLKSALLGDITSDMLSEGAYILYYAKSSDYPQLALPDKWPSLQAAGEMAAGVLVKDGAKTLVVAPTAAQLPWSSASLNGGATVATSRSEAIADMDGKANTAAIIAASSSEAITNTNSYAPGFCNQYSRPNANGVGLTAGKWWLPSLGELFIILANKNKINRCLGVISGAEQLQSLHLSSTEYGKDNEWKLYLESGLIIQWGPKHSELGSARPVSEII